MVDSDRVAGDSTSSPHIYWKITAILVSFANNRIVGELTSSTDCRAVIMSGECGINDMHVNTFHST